MSKYGSESGGLRGGTILVFGSGNDSGVKGIDSEDIEDEQVDAESNCGEVFIRTFFRKSVW
jgi:hypothetical protein